MMKPRFSFLTLYLVIALLIISCSPASATQETVVLPPTVSSANDPVVVTESTIPNVEATQVPAVESIATSRGDSLHATDPSTVSLASGQLQLVEFFRFT